MGLLPLVHAGTRQPALANVPRAACGRSLLLYFAKAGCPVPALRSAGS